MAKRLNLDSEWIVAQYREHGSCSRIATALGVSRGTIERRLVDAGFTEITDSFRVRVLNEEERHLYYRWTRAVIKRDQGRCRVCGKGGKVAVHHIQTWKSTPDRRFDVTNGMTLCPEHHYMTYKREEYYEEQFFAILANDTPAPVEVQVEPPNERMCTACGEVKLLSEFNKQAAGPWGHRCQCRQCQAEYSASLRHKNKEQYRAAVSAWYSRNKEHRRLYHTKRSFNATLLAGKVPNWTRIRARFGLVPKERDDWPTQEILEKVRKCKVS